MKKLIVLAVAALVAAPAFAGEMKWSGSTGWRYTSASHNDGLNTTITGSGDTSKQDFRQHAFRANLGANGGWKSVEWGAGVRTGGAGSINSDYATVTSGGDLAVGLEQAWFRYMLGSRFGDWNFTFGRQMNAFAYDSNTQLFFDNDVRFDGISMSWSWGSFGLNASHYVLGAFTSGGAFGGTAGSSQHTSTASSNAQKDGGHFVTLQGIQPHFSWKFRDDIDTMIGVGFYSWGKTEGIYTNAVHGAGANGDTASGDAGSVTLANPSQMQIYNTWNLPYKFAFSWEYVKNKKAPKFGSTQVEAETKSLSLALNYGMIKRAHDFKIGYAYGSKDLGSVINTFANNRFLADNKGHIVSATYALADNFNLGWKGYFLKEKSRKNATTGVALTTTQEQKSNLWELTAGVSF